jgi:hypothetical protein
MSSAVTERSTIAPSASPEPPAGGYEPNRLWPLAVLFVGFPIWWILGLGGIIPLVLVLPMAVQLWRTRQVVVPNGFGWWVLFLAWVLIGAATLWTDAPGAVPGGGGLSRLAVYGYRVCWYAACTIVLLWVANASRRALPFAKVASLIGWLFVFTVIGGLLGVFASTVELTSVLELLLPRGLSSNGFVHSLVHPGLADVQTILGRPQARPKAPFAFANSWGSNFSLTLPFFLIGWWRYGRPWQRLAVPVVLLLGAIPVVYSLNRGLWFSLLLGAAFLVVLQVSRGKVIALFLVLLALTVSTLVLVASPLGTLVTERFEHQHSNERRGDLLTQTVVSTLTGSPVIGFGNTRDVQGSFASIAGASTPDCSACGVPPLGTQGHLWLVIFAQGLVGACFFLMFFISSFFRSWRCRSEPEAVATCLLLFLGLQLFIYDTLGMPLFLVMIALGLGWREHSTVPGSSSYLLRVATLRGYADQLRGAAPLVAVLVICGIAGGAAWAASAPRSYTAQEMVLLAPSPSHLVTGLASGHTPKETTIDTEAALVLSDATLQRVAAPSQSLAELRSKISVTAVPNTQVLVLSMRDESPAEAERVVRELSADYLDVRRQNLLDRRTQVLGQLRNRYSQLATLGSAPAASELPGNQTQGAVAAELQSVDNAINTIILTPTTAGEVLRQSSAEEAPRNYALFAASGGALGLLAALFLTLLRVRLLQRSARRELIGVDR